MLLDEPNDDGQGQRGEDAEELDTQVLGDGEGEHLHQDPEVKRIVAHVFEHIVRSQQTNLRGLLEVVVDKARTL